MSVDKEEQRRLCTKEDYISAIRSYKVDNVDGRLSTSRYNLLLKIVNNPKCFDKKDNTFKISNRGISKEVNVAPDTINRLMIDIKIRGLVRVIDNIYNHKVYMLNPAYLCSGLPSFEYWFCKAMFHLGGHSQALDWVTSCWRLGSLIDPDTKEDLGLIGDRLNIDRLHRQNKP